MFFRDVLKSFVAAISKYSHEKIYDGVWQCSKTFSSCIPCMGQFVENFGVEIMPTKSPMDTYPGSIKQYF